MPVVLPEQPVGTRLMVAIVMLSCAGSFVAAVVVANLTSSVGWGFVVAAACFVTLLVLAVPLGALQRRVIASKRQEQDEDLHDR